MRRSFVAVALLAFALTAALGGARAPRLAAQEATPAATPETVPGVTVEPAGLVLLEPGVGVPSSRVTLAPGAALPPHTSPGAAVARVEAGQVSYVVITGAARRTVVTIVPSLGTPVAGTPVAGTPVTGTPTAEGTPGALAMVEEAVVVVGQETPLGPGQGVAFGPDVVHTFRNTGTEPAVLLVAGEYPPDQPPFRFVEAEAGATPAGTPTA